jgi:hypothetical protein
MSLKWLAFPIMAGCAGTPVSPRLIADKDRLVVSHPPAGSGRDDFLLVRSATPIAGTTTHQRVGVLRVVNTDGASQTVCWEAGPYAPLNGLEAEGLPVEPIPEDRLLSLEFWMVGMLPASSTCEGAPAILQIDRGTGDGLQAGMVYELLGEPIVDPITRRFIDQKVMGRCTVREDGLGPTSARCQVDAAHPIRAADCRAGGRLRVLPASVCERPPCPVVDACRPPP